MHTILIINNCNYLQLFGFKNYAFLWKLCRLGILWKSMSVFLGQGPLSTCATSEAKLLNPGSWSGIKGRSGDGCGVDDDDVW